MRLQVEYGLRLLSAKERRANNLSAGGVDAHKSHWRAEPATHHAVVPVACCILIVYKHV